MKLDPGLGVPVSLALCSALCVFPCVVSGERSGIRRVPGRSNKDGEDGRVSRGEPDEKVVRNSR